MSRSEDERHGSQSGDTIRFHALLLEFGLIKNNPEKLIAQVPTGDSFTS
jgi:hypothetical protein